MRAVWTLLVALGASALTACASSKSCGCEQQLERVWVPPRTMTTVCYETVAPLERERHVECSGLCRQPVYGPSYRPIVEHRVVPDVCTAKAPVTEWVCAPTMGYREVEDRKDRFCPTLEMQCKPVQEKVTVVRLGVGWACCAPKFTATATKECRTVLRPVPVKTGETLVSVPAGSHWEQVQVGQAPARMPVGEQEVTGVSGAHIESVQTGVDKSPVVVGEEYHIISKGHRTEGQEVRPWRYHAVERQVTLPGFWAVICADPSESNGADVITRAEYEEYLRDARK